jgi:hypothetical protein
MMSGQSDCFLQFFHPSRPRALDDGTESSTSSVGATQAGRTRAIHAHHHKAHVAAGIYCSIPFVGRVTVQRCLIFTRITSDLPEKSSPGNCFQKSILPRSPWETGKLDMVACPVFAPNVHYTKIFGRAKMIKI